MILVIGATSQLGVLTIKHLRTKIGASQLVALVRDKKEGTALAAKGVTLRISNYQHKRLMHEAFVGIDKVFLIASGEVTNQLNQPMYIIDAAKEAGVNYMLYTDLPENDVSSSPHQFLGHDHQQIEDYIKASGLAYSLMQTNLYMEILPWLIGDNVLTEGIHFPAGSGRIAFIALQDAAEAAAAILTQAGQHNRLYTIANRCSYLFNDIAAILSKLAGKRVHYTDTEPTLNWKNARKAGVPNYRLQLLSRWAEAISQNEFDKPSGQLLRLLGGEIRPLEGYLEAAYIHSHRPGN